MQKTIGENDATILSMGEVKTETTVGQAIAPTVKLIFLYFSMKECPPCRDFTPLLTCLYHEMNEAEKVFEVIFMSGDATVELYNEYLPHQPWLAMAHKDPRIRAAAT